MSGVPPSGPAVSFGSYIKPETVRYVPEPDPVALPFIAASRAGAPRAKQQQLVDPKFVAAGLVGVCTFALGAIASLYLAGDTQAKVVDTPVALPQVAMAEVIAAPVEETTPPEEAVATPVALARVVAASLEQGVTRNTSSDLITPSGAMSQASAEALSMTEILLGLAPQRAPLTDTAADTQNIINRDKLQLLRESVLAGTYTVKTVKRGGIDRLCLRIPQHNVTQDEAADLIRQAADRGEIALPAALNTADGRFDADTLIFNLVQTSLANDGTEAGRRAAEEMSRRASAASKAKTNQVDGVRTYLVEPGDSLAYISLLFYGKPRGYPKIFNANRNILTSPDEIQIGQRLIIPS